TSDDTMVTGRWCASSVAASNVPWATSRSTRRSASSVIEVRTAASACGVSEPRQRVQAVRLQPDRATEVPELLVARVRVEQGVVAVQLEIGRRGGDGA